MTWTEKSLMGAKCRAQDDTGDVENWISTLGRLLETGECSSGLNAKHYCYSSMSESNLT